MNTVLIVCGAGASSTFLASRMRAIAASRHVAVSVTAASDADLDLYLAGVDVLLVGPHLAPSFESLRQRASKHGVAAALLPATAFQAGGAEAAFDLIAGLIPTGQPVVTTLTEGASHG